MEQPVLETERLILSPFVDDDAQRLSELAGDKAVSDTTLRIPYPYDVTEALEWIRTHAKIRERELALYYAVILKDSGELIGSAGIDIELPHGRAELGYSAHDVGGLSYGWLRPEGVRKKLEEMTANLQGPAPMMVAAGGCHGVKADILNHQNDGCGLPHQSTQRSVR